MGGVLATARVLSPEAQNIPQRQASSSDDTSPGFFEGIAASYRNSKDELQNVQQNRLNDSYTDLVRDVARASGVPIYKFRRPFAGRADIMDAGDPWNTEAVWSQIGRLRAADPNALAAAGKDQAEFERMVVTRQGQHQADQQMAAKAGMVSGFIGGFGAGFHDPVNWLGMMLGGPGSTTFARALLNSAATNAVVAAAAEPGRVMARKAMGEETTFGDMAKDVGMAAALGAGMHATVAGAAKGLQMAVDRIPLSAKVGAALKASNPQAADLAQVAKAFEDRVPEIYRTPDEAAALNVVNRAAEVAASNPYEATYAGQDLHQARLSGATEKLLTGAAERAVRARGLDPEIVSFFRGKGFSEGQARGIAAGIAAESGGNHRAVNPKSGAFGLGQWLGSRRAALIERYGENPTKAQQLEFLHHELTGGDHGGRHVLAQSEESAVLDAYIRKFMRPKAGAETDGDLTRGMAALGRGEEMAARAEGLGDMAEVEAARAEARSMDAEASAMDMASMATRDSGAVDTVPGLDPHPSETMPRLQMDLFSDETTARVAQAAADADTLGVETPAYSRQQAWAEARDQLMRDQAGEVPGALYHPEVGPIDLVWGDESAGLAKIVDKHPEVLANLPELIDNMGVKSHTANRVILQSLDHRAVVRLDYDGQDKKWLLSAYQVQGKAPKAADYRGVALGARDHSPSAGAEADISLSPESGKGAAMAAKDAPRPDLAQPGADVVADPVGAAAQVQADGMLHDVRADLDAGKLKDVKFTVSDTGEVISAEQALARMDADQAAFDALKGCL